MAKFTWYIGGRQTVHFVHPRWAFMQEVQLLDSEQARTLTYSGFFDKTPGANCISVHKETMAYKQVVGEVDSAIHPVTFWLSPSVPISPRFWLCK